MDYRLVKQFSNNAVDNFFNFFYKMVDFAMELIDVFWAFMDIWYHFFMIFINIWLYFYYFTLFVIDKLTMSKLFTAKGSSRGHKPGTKAYSPHAHVPHNPMYGKVELPSLPKVMPAPKSSGKVKNVASALASTITRPSRPSGMKKNYLKDIAETVLSFFREAGRFFTKIFKSIVSLLGTRLKPVKEEPSQGKSLIDEYMKEYEKKKK